MKQITTDDLFGNVCMLDLTSPEVNRGSYCYLSYLIYSGLMNAKLPLNGLSLHEEFRIADMEQSEYDLEHADFVLVGLWSYPQQETALLLNRFLKGRCYFYGYYPLIKQLGLNVCQYTEDLLLRGMDTYPKKLAKQTFKYDLLSDCDKHIKDQSKLAASGSSSKMVPMFTSYGCNMGCKFCSATVNCEKKRLALEPEQVLNNLQFLYNHGVDCVHFTDEDFFYNPTRAAHILSGAYKISKRFQFIALGGMSAVNKFVDYIMYACTEEERDEIWHVLRLIEIGLETADPKLAVQMGKTGAQKRESASLVAEKVRCKILWLTMTFAPGETIGSLNRTGAFLKQHGLKADEMEERIVTNGTEGGLGQFFQFYHGCGMSWRQFARSGVVLTQRPMRLVPSYIPNSFLRSKYNFDEMEYKNRRKDYEFWCGVYGYEPLDSTDLRLGIKNCESDNYVSMCQTVIQMAIAARLNIIKGD